MKRKEANGKQANGVNGVNGVKGTNGVTGAHSSHHHDGEVVMEFGGPVGVGIMMVFFPCLMYYLWITSVYYNGHLPYPSGLSDIGPFFGRMVDHVRMGAAPSWDATIFYFSVLIFEFIIAMFMPGHVVKGLPIPHEGGKQLDYYCNGVSCWWLTIILGFSLHFTGIFSLTFIIEEFGPIMTVAIIFGHSISWLTYFLTVFFGKPHRMSGHFLFDVFMGAPLNPRLLGIDMKLWAEIRVPWVILFFVTLSANLKFYQSHGYVSIPLLFMLLAHFLYTNACMKGEECIVTTWDIFYEKWGFMLIFWNFAGVPFTYVLSTLYLSNVSPPIQHNPLFSVGLFVVLLTSYYIWDTANSQKNHFRQQLAGTFVPRRAFPQLPWRTLTPDAKHLDTKAGSKLLIDGWWRYARKIHYTSDLIMALSWGLICGFDSLIPYFYFVFFLAVLTHRTVRDMQRCARKYGSDWDNYCKIVPYIFIPGLY